MSLVKSLNPLIKEESVELSRRKHLISGDGYSGCRHAEFTGIAEVRVVVVASVNVDSLQTVSPVLQEPVRGGPYSEEVKSRCSEIALAISEAKGACSRAALTACAGLSLLRRSHLLTPSLSCIVINNLGKDP